MKSNSELNLKKGPWSLEEDQMLISYISRHGIWNWSQMPRFAGLLRSGKSCRLRWMNYLKPSLKKGNFSKEEDEIIIQSHAVLGNRWSAIASRLPGRTDSDIKNHWHVHLKKRVNDHYNPIPKTTKQNDDNAKIVQQHVNIEVDSCSTSNNDTLLSCSTTTIKDQQVDFQDDYYDTSSPGTVDELECFWQQLCSENMDIMKTNT